MGKIKNVDILVGGQFGSEGKGLVASWLAEQEKYDWLVSVNSAQAGHTVYYVGKKLVTRQLPASCITNHGAKIYIGAGAIINFSVLLAEIKNLEKHNIPIRNRLFINRNATIISEEEIREEKESKLDGVLGSTCEGVGSALAKRCWRKAKIIKDYEKEISFECSGVSFLDDSEFLYGDIFLEGSQGFGLSVFSKYYPFSTSRDTTPSAFLSYAGLPPTNIRYIYGVFRTYPIRVGGNSGEMKHELTWEEIDKMSGYSKLGEYTTVTGRLRRIGEFDCTLAKEAIRVCGINRLILTFVNYFNCEDEGVEKREFLSDTTERQVYFLEEILSTRFFAMSTSKDGGWIL